MAENKTKPTKEQYLKAVDTLAEWFPENAALLKRNRDTIIDCILAGTKPPPGSPLAASGKLQSGAGEEGQGALQAQSVSPCVEACLVVTLDVILFVFGLVGLHVSNQERLTRALLREMGEDTLRGLARAIHNFSTADGALAKAKALFTLMGQIYNAGGFKAAIKVIKDEMTTWEWIKTGVIAVAQITAWFATDGIAFIAEAALSIMSAVQLIEDAVKAGNACSC